MQAAMEDKINHSYKSATREKQSKPEMSQIGSNMRKRQITEKRRAQGRAAQRAYRQKQKAHLSTNLEQKNQTADISSYKAHQVPTENIYAAHKPLILSKASHLDGLLGLNLDLRSEVWDPDFDAMGVLQSVDANNDSLAGFLSLPAQPGTNTEPSNALVKPNSLTPSIPMDIYIRIQRYSFHAACIENAIVLGVTFAQIKDHKCGHDRLISPWVSQSMHTKLNENTVVPDLSPGNTQRTQDHDLYIDCLPFKDFREKLLALRSVEPKIFDEEEFIRDLDHRDAMRCWGPTPWENKSWEVQAWFLKKWWMITGGESEEMGTTSRWWRMFRGEPA